MRKLLLLLLVMLFGMQYMHGQTSDVVLDNPKERPIVIIDDDIVPFDVLGQFPSDSIDHINVLGRKTARLFYGKQARYGAIQIITKQLMAKIEEFHNSATKDYEPIGYECAPEWPGGEAEMRKYIYSHVVYPTDAIDLGIQGTVVTRVFITTEGKVENPQILQPLFQSMDEEVLRVLGGMDRFTPALNTEGNPVGAYVIIPVTFKLED